MKARTLLITGNGLDLKSNLKSNYKNFFNQKNKMINDIYHYDRVYDSLFVMDRKKTVKNFNEDLRKQCNDLYWLEQWIKRHYILKYKNSDKVNSEDKYDSDENVFQFFEHIEKVLMDEDYSYWLLPHVMRQEMSKNWNSIEKSISDYVMEISRGKDFMGKFKLLKLAIEKRCFIKDDKSFMENNKSFCNFNLFMIIFKEILRNKDIIVTNAMDKEKKSNCSEKDIYDCLEDEFFVTILQINIDEFLISELNKLEDMFSNYLKYEVERKNYKNNVIKNIYNLVGMDPVDILNFNYTEYENYLKNSDIEYRVNLKDIFNIHGSISDHVIFGIDNSSNEKQENDIHVPMFTKTYRIMSKTKKAMMFETNERVSNNDISYLADQSYDVIKFFGHSLSDADYSYFQSIFDKLDLYNSDVILEFYYSKHRKDSEYPDRDMHKVENNVFSLLSKYGETLDNKNRGNNLMHKLLVEGRLVIKELK
ncbi:AbiH family protein [Apilactobacillus kunkeei]|uniref:AbiH family protein n=1 Tax=Apilactobacillus kunkeei TaxID=148814 RepID=UPI0006C48FCA|nr:AbiH family protein [Apilactobacillus kunkeei]KOY72152.1 hypothetical protein RZ55_06680 [Apilactobacillus kunkeei]